MAAVETITRSADFGRSPMLEKPREFNEKRRDVPKSC
jgi:hypothetical protein